MWSRRFILIALSTLSAVQARGCTPLSNSKAPFWRGLLKNFIPGEHDQFRSVLSPESTAAQQCLGSMDLSRWQMRGLIGNKACIVTMREIFAHNDPLKNVFRHYEWAKTFMKHLLALSSSIKTDAFESTANAFREFMAATPSDHYKKKCGYLKSHMIECITELFLPVIHAKFLKGSCCKPLQAQFQQSFGHSIDLPFMKRLINIAFEISCSTVNESKVCAEQLIQSLLDSSDFTAMLATENQSAFCALANQEAFNMTNGETYEMKQSIGCCAERVDYHLQQAQKDFPMFQTDLAKRFLSESSTIATQELSKLIQSLISSEALQTTAYHLPLGFSSSCEFNSRCQVP